MGFFETVRSSFLHHLSLYHRNQVANIAFDDLTNLLNRLHVLSFRLIAFAWSQAILDMVFQANLELPILNGHRFQAQVASAPWIQTFYQVQQSVHHLPTWVRTKIFRTIFDDLPSWKNPRESFVLDANPRIGFVVLQRNVIAWLILFDQVVFQQQSIQLSIHNDRSDINDFRNQHTGFPAVVMVFAEIGVNSFLKTFRLADVQNLSFCIKILIHSRLFGQRLQ